MAGLLFEWIGHHKLFRQVTVRAKIRGLEPLLVGAGKEAILESPADITLLKILDVRSGSLKPVIPGSSWKGAFRAHAVRLCRTCGLNVCDGVPRSTCLRGTEFKQLERAGASIFDKLNMIVTGGISVCILDLIFGAPGILSHVFFNDSYPTNNYRIGYRTMVAIDRRTGASSRSALFTVEYVEPGAIFDFTLIVENLPNYALGLLFEVLKDLNEGIVKVGGLKSRGFGRVAVESLSIAIKEFGSNVKALRALDPIDEKVDVGTEVLEGEEAWELVDNLIGVWHRSLDKLRKISDEGWRWGAVVEGAGR